MAAGWGGCPQTPPPHIPAFPSPFLLLTKPTVFCSRKPGVFREAPVAARLVPEGGRSLPAGPEGAREGGLPPPQAAAQAAVALLERSLLAVLFCGLLVVPVLLLGCGLRRRHPLLTLLLSCPPVLAPLLSASPPPPSRDKGTHITRTLRAELFSPASSAQQERSWALWIRTGALRRSPALKQGGGQRLGGGEQERAENAGILSLGWRTLESKGRLLQPRRSWGLGWQPPPGDRQCTARVLPPPATFFR